MAVPKNTMSFMCSLFHQANTFKSNGQTGGQMDNAEVPTYAGDTKIILNSLLNKYVFHSSVQFSTNTSFISTIHFSKNTT